MSLVHARVTNHAFLPAQVRPLVYTAVGPRAANVLKVRFQWKVEKSVRDTVDNVIIFYSNISTVQTLVKRETFNGKWSEKLKDMILI